ncbi:MAG: class I SAM-dependent methyltransferase [Candidatus Bathyarchaeia archaeon]
MALEFKIRDSRHPRADILKEVELKQGSYVLDYGCGPGGYVLPASKMIGETGKLYALDVTPLAIKMVKDIVSKNGLKNVETIQSDCATGLPNESVDAALLYDVFHDLEDQKAVLEEIHRVLKKDGIISFSDHHLKEQGILLSVTDGELFKLLRRQKHTYTFVKNKKNHST